MPDDDFEQVWRQLDADRDGKVTLDEFVDSILHKQVRIRVSPKPSPNPNPNPSPTPNPNQYTTSHERACPLRSRQDNLALIRQKSRGWQPAPGEARAAPMAVEAKPVASRTGGASKGPPSGSHRRQSAFV